MKKCWTMGLDSSQTQKQQAVDHRQSVHRRYYSQRASKGRHIAGRQPPRWWSKHHAAQMPGVCAAFLFVRSAAAAEPSPDFSHDFVDLIGLQKSRFLFQLRPPSHQDCILSLLLVIAFVGNL